MAKPSKLSLAVAGARKIIGAAAAKPQMVMMPKTVSELHVAGPEKDAKGKQLKQERNFCCQKHVKPMRPHRRRF